MKYLIPIIVLAAIITAFFFWERAESSSNLTLYGNIDLRQVNLGFRVFGKLKKVHVDEGSVIQKGELLAELDDAPYIQNLKESHGRVKSLKENLAFIDTQLDRRSYLVEGRSVSEEDYQQAFFGQKSSLANLEQAEAQKENALIQLRDCKMYSPSPGIIYTRVSEPGTILNPGEPVYSLALQEEIWARTYISEGNLGRVHPGMRAKIYTDTSENPVYEGHVGFISPIAEFTPKNVESPELRTNLVYQLRVIIDNPDNGLRLGMPVTIKFD